MVQARLLLQKGCEFCPTSDDIWLEASRMQANPESAKAVLARGVAALPNSIKLWLQACFLLLLCLQPDPGIEAGRHNLNPLLR